MNYQSICRGLYKKASSEQLRKLASLIGMRKRAGEGEELPLRTFNHSIDGRGIPYSQEPHLIAPAGIGLSTPQNAYIKQLNENYEKMKAKYPDIESIGYAAQVPFPFYGKGKDYITVGDADLRREIQARSAAQDLFDKYTPQYQDAVDWLIDEGEKNQRKALRGELWNIDTNDTPQNQTFPSSIKDPKKRRALWLQKFRQSMNVREPQHSQYS